MPDDNNPATPPAHALARLTWTVTCGFADEAPLEEVASAAGRPVEVIAADPACLRGAAPTRLADLLAYRQSEDTAVGGDEVEITEVEIAEQPTLGDLVDAAWEVLQGESDADCHTDAGRALAALLAGLRREELLP